MDPFSLDAWVWKAAECTRKESGELYGRLYCIYPTEDAQADERGHERRAYGLNDDSQNCDLEYLAAFKSSGPGRYKLTFVPQRRGSPRLTGMEFEAAWPELSA